jgi:hypothetical protein
MQTPEGRGGRSPVDHGRHRLSRSRHRRGPRARRPLPCSTGPAIGQRLRRLGRRGSAAAKSARKTRWDATLAAVEAVVHLAGAAHLPDTTMAAPSTPSRASTRTVRPGSLGGGGYRHSPPHIDELGTRARRGKSPRAARSRKRTNRLPPTLARSKPDAERRLIAAARGSGFTDGVWRAGARQLSTPRSSIAHQHAAAGAATAPRTSSASITWPTPSCVA